LFETGKGKAKKESERKNVVCPLLFFKREGTRGGSKQKQVKEKKESERKNVVCPRLFRNR